MASLPPTSPTSPVPPVAPSLSRRERKAAETRDRIFQSAITLFADRGVENVTVEQITERADVGKGTFFNYFPNKEAILTHFGGSQIERLRTAIAAGEITGTPRERIHEMLQVLAGHPNLTRELGRALFISGLRNRQFPEVEAPVIWQMQGFVAEVVRQGQELGAFRPDIAADDGALFVLGQYFLALLSWCSGFGEESLPDTVRHFAALALDALARV